MESIVYDFSADGDKELERSYDVFYDDYMSHRREIQRDSYIELLESIKKFKHKKGIYDYLVNNDDTSFLDNDLKLFNKKWINQDAELIEWVKTTPASIKSALVYGMSRVRMRNEDNKKKMQEMYSDIDSLKKMLFNCRTVKGSLQTYFVVCIENSSYLSDPEILDVLSHGNYLQYEEDTIKGLLENKKLNNAFLLKEYFSIEGEQRKNFNNKIDKILNSFDDEEIIKKEIENLMYIIRKYNQGQAAGSYMDMYDLPCYKDEKIRQYIFKVALSYLETKNNMTFSRYLMVIYEALKDEKLRNNKELLKSFSKAAGWYHSRLLLNCFKDERVVQNKDLINLIVNMPNFYTLEQLMLAYETNKIGNNMDILTQIASYSPDVKLMESARNKYGQSESEKERIKRLTKVENENRKNIEAQARRYFR